MIRSTTHPRKVWKFVSHEDVSFQTFVKGQSFSNDWLDIKEDGTMIVKGSFAKGYAWDGCTPKWEMLDFVAGTPDGRFDYDTEKPITYYASMIHDVLYQFKKEVPVSRKQTDRIFRDELKKPRFFWTPVYYTAVRIFGAPLGTWKIR